MTKIVIIGAGAVGASVAEALSTEGNDVTVVDNCPEALRNTSLRQLDIRMIQGEAGNPDVLEQANVEDADMLLAVTKQDDSNIVACQLAHILGNTPRLIARIRNQALNKSKDVLFGRGPDQITIDEIISPERLVTEHIMRLIDHPGALQLVEFAQGKIQLIGIRADESGKLVGHKIRELRKHMPDVDTRVAAVYQKGGGKIPKGDTVIQPGDVVFFIATPEHLADVVDELRVVDKETGNRIMLVGAGNIGMALASELISRDSRVVLIEVLETNAAKAAEEVPKCLVICADATNADLLERENVASMDVFCAVTNHDETNILSAMMAKKLGAKRTMALVNNSAYVDLLDDSGVDIVISPNLNTISELLKFVRTGGIVAAHSLRRGAAEALETIALGKSRESNVVGRRVDELKLPEGTTVGAILRDDEVLIAHHDTLIQEDDHVILFVVDKSGKKIKRVQKLFEPNVFYIEKSSRTS